jgi:hypothetical protein
MPASSMAEALAFIAMLEASSTLMSWATTACGIDEPDELNRLILGGTQPKGHTSIAALRAL